MPLFDGGFKAKAKTELEREIREIEEKSKKAQAEEKNKDAQFIQEFYEASLILNSNLKFAKKLGLISKEQENEYKERLKKAHQELNNVRKIEEQNTKKENQMSMEETEIKVKELREQRRKEEEAAREAAKNKDKAGTENQPNGSTANEEPQHSNG